MFTLVACLVVVGVSAAAVLWQTLGGAYQPATERLSGYRQSGLGHIERAAATLRHLATAAGQSGDDAGGSGWLPSPPRDDPVEQAVAEARPPAPRRGFRRRLQAAAQLFLLVVLIG